MIGEEFTCALESCNNTGIKTTHNQKYCSNVCCKIQTNANIIADYHEKVAIKKGKKRLCKKCKKSVLSRYNTEGQCASCAVKKKQPKRDTTSTLVSSVNWL